MSFSQIDTTAISERYRSKALDLDNRRLLMTNFAKSEQQKDFSLPSNCGGFGRVHQFNRSGGSGWPLNPLPIDPAQRTLNLAPTDGMRAQVFQNAVCNWRCWYCFVDFKLLSGHPDHSKWLSVDELVALYGQEPRRSALIDLSGGQPDLIPEWVPWMMESLRAAGLDQQTYLWSDDNLSTDYFWRYLSPAQQELVASYPNYGRVCCFKGFDEESFAFNTGAAPHLWEQQFDLMRRFVESRINVYGYVTLTTANSDGIKDKISRFMDRLQAIHPHLPLRVVPLEVKIFSPVAQRLSSSATSLQNAVGDAVKLQWQAVEHWQSELKQRFDSSLRHSPICDIKFD